MLSQVNHQVSPTMPRRAAQRTHPRFRIPDRTIKVWDAGKGQEVLTLRGQCVSEGDRAVP
jgi:hypothetical protein